MMRMRHHKAIHLHPQDAEAATVVVGSRGSDVIPSRCVSHQALPVAKRVAGPAEAVFQARVQPQAKPTATATAATATTTCRTAQAQAAKRARVTVAAARSTAAKRQAVGSGQEEVVVVPRPSVHRHGAGLKGGDEALPRAEIVARPPTNARVGDGGTAHD